MSFKQGAKVECPYCKQPAKLVTGACIYAHRPDLSTKLFYQCQPCGAHVGTHAATVIPLGTLANPELRAARQAAHAIFDPIWQGGKTTRKQAYAQLAEKLAINPRLCHIGMFDIPTCKAAIGFLNEL